MDHDRQHADGPEEHDVLGETGERFLLVTDGAAAVFRHHDPSAKRRM